VPPCLRHILFKSDSDEYTNVFTIENTDNSNISYALFNLDGIMAKNGLIAGGQGKMKVNIENQPDGIYFLQTKGNRGIKFRK